MNYQVIMGLGLQSSNRLVTQHTYFVSHIVRGPKSSWSPCIPLRQTVRVISQAPHLFIIFTNVKPEVYPNLVNKKISP